MSEPGLWLHARRVVAAMRHDTHTLLNPDDPMDHGPEFSTEEAEIMDELAAAWAETATPAEVIAVCATALAWEYSTIMTYQRFYDLVVSTNPAALDACRPLSERLDVLAGAVKKSVEFVTSEKLSEMCFALVIDPGFSALWERELGDTRMPTAAFEKVARLQALSSAEGLWPVVSALGCQTPAATEELLDLARAVTNEQ